MAKPKSKPDVACLWIELSPETPEVLRTLRAETRVFAYVESCWAVVRRPPESTIADLRDLWGIPVAARVTPCGPKDGPVQARQLGLFGP